MLFVFIYVYCCPTPFLYPVVFVSYNSNTRNATSREGTVSVAPEFTSVFSGVRVALSFVFCVVFCRTLFVPCLLAIALSVLFQFTISDYPLGFFKGFFAKLCKSGIFSVGTNNWKVFWNKKSKGHIQENKNRLRLLIHEDTREITLSVNNNYIIKNCKLQL